MTSSLHDYCYKIFYDNIFYKLVKDPEECSIMANELVNILDHTNYQKTMDIINKTLANKYCSDNIINNTNPKTLTACPNFTNHDIFHSIVIRSMQLDADAFGITIDIMFYAYLVYLKYINPLEKIMIFPETIEGLTEVYAQFIKAGRFGFFCMHKWDGSIAK